MTESAAGEKLGEGREAEVFAWGDGAVLKLYRPGFEGHQVEALTLGRLDGHGLAPRLIELVAEDGRTGLVLERLGGVDMLALLERQPWRVIEWARLLASTHRAVHDIAAPGDLPDVRDVLADRIGDADLPESLRAFALEVLGTLPAGDRLYHGDFHPGNVLVAGDGARVIDWANAARGVPDADHARTLLLLRWADPLPGTPLLSRALVMLGRSLFARGYAKAYPTESVRQLDDWLTVHAAARLSEGIAVEHATLVRYLQRAHHRAAGRPARA
jgi:Phosphotransferase enzyme family